jgi:hypothetical protein
MGIRKSGNDRQHNDQKKRDKWTNNDLQNITPKTKDRVTRTLLKTEGELKCSGRVSNSCSTIDQCYLFLNSVTYGSTYVPIRDLTVVLDCQMLFYQLQTVHF